MSLSQINVVLSASISTDSNASQRVDKALKELQCITYDELTDDIWAAIKLLQKHKQAK